MENNKNPKARRAKCAALLFSIWQRKPGKKTTNGNRFFIKGRPNFWPQVENRLWVVLALNKKPALGGFFSFENPLLCPIVQGLGERTMDNLKIVRKIAKVRKFTKIVPVRAGNLSTIPFCTEFGCDPTVRLFLLPAPT